MKAHLAAFQEKHNVSIVTLGLLALLAVENNVLAAAGLFPV